MTVKYVIRFKIILIFVSVISCNKNEATEVVVLKTSTKNIVGEKLVLPDNIESYTPFSKYIGDSCSLFNSDYKIYSKVNASASTCISYINLWNNISSEFGSRNVPVILIFQSDDHFKLIRFMCRSGQIKNFPDPFFFDKRNEFGKKNKFMTLCKNCETVVTDRSNNILLVGNPTHSIEMKELYLKEILARTVKD